MPTPDRWAWLKRLNTSLSAWAATLSWWRMALLGLIALIAVSAMTDALQLSHDTRHTVSLRRSTKAVAPQTGSASDCSGDEIHIGGSQGIVIREAACGAKAAGLPASGASATSLPASPDAAAADTSEDEAHAEDFPISAMERTFGGVVHDIISALLIALFAYFAAAKIIVRKTAESDAKLRVANDSAEREAMQRQLVQARLKLLQAQVEPHFLFNTLAAVDYLIETDPQRASAMQKLLISYLRAALPQMRQESSTLGRELTLIRPYLELLKLRIEDRLSYEILVPAGLESAVFPPMVLQSLVENAIKHGIEPKPEGGRVTVLAEVVDGELRVDVMDSGVGLPQGDIYSQASRGTGLGLDNIRNRLALLYPGKSHMALRPGDNGGTLVRVTIPYQTETPPHDEKPH